MEVRDLLLGCKKEVWPVQELHTLPSFSVSQAWKREWGEVVGCDQLRRDDPYLLQCLCQLHRQALDQWSPNLVLGLWSTVGFLFCQVVNCIPLRSEAQIGLWSHSHNEKCYGKNEQCLDPWQLKHFSFTCENGSFGTWHGYVKNTQSKAVKNYLQLV